MHWTSQWVKRFKVSHHPSSIYCSYMRFSAKVLKNVRFGISMWRNIYIYIFCYIYIHTHTHTHLCVCVCVDDILKTFYIGNLCLFSANSFSIYVCIPFTITRNSYFVTACRWELYILPVKAALWEFQGCPVAETLHSQWRGPKFNPWPWNKILHTTIRSLYSAIKDSSCCSY